MAGFIIDSIILLRYSAPSIIQTNNGSEFDNQLVANLCTTLEITHKFQARIILHKWNG